MRAPVLEFGRTRVVFPAPEGAEIITALPWKSLDEFIRCLKLVL